MFDFFFFYNKVKIVQKKIGVSKDFKFVYYGGGGDKGKG